MRAYRDAADRDLYELLGVGRNATADEIRRAYRRLARKYHPDLHPGDREAEERFKRISVAHQILADPKRRRLYDEFGLEGLQPGFDPSRARRFARAGARPQGPFSGGQERGEGWAGVSFDDIVNELFAGIGRGTRSRGRGRDIELELEVDLLEALRGSKRKVAVRRAVKCTACAGSAMDPRSGALCRACDGRGKTRLGPAAIGLERVCAACAGSGRIGGLPCRSCGGRRRVEKTDRLLIKIPAGVRDGSKIRVAGKGEEGLGGASTGDLILAVKIKPHPFLERRGNDLVLNLPLTVGEAIKGCVVNVPTVDGVVRLKVPAGTQSGQKLRLKGKGVEDPHTGERGDMYVRILVHVPPLKGVATGEAVEVLERSYEESPRKDLRI